MSDDDKKYSQEMRRALADALRSSILIDKIADRMTELLQEGMTMDEVAAMLEIKPRDVDDLTRRRRGPQPGTGGRPRIGTEKKAKLGFSVDAEVARWIEQQRRPDENFSQTMERLLRSLMNADDKVN